MSLSTVVNVISQPFGTARLLEGFCTLSRMAQAKVTPAQMRVAYPDLSNCSDDDIRGFVKIGNMFVSGEARVSGRIFPKPSLAELA